MLLSKHNNDQTNLAFFLFQAFWHAIYSIHQDAQLEDALVQPIHPIKISFAKLASMVFSRSDCKSCNALTKFGLLFINFEHPKRLRVHGIASIHLEDELLSEYPESKYIVRIKITNVFDNCSRYIHKMHSWEISEFVPKTGCKTPVPDWKLREVLKMYSQKIKIWINVKCFLVRSNIAPIFGFKLVILKQSSAFGKYR